MSELKFECSLTDQVVLYEKGTHGGCSSMELLDEDTMRTIVIFLQQFLLMVTSLSLKHSPRMHINFLNLNVVNTSG